MKSAEEHIIFGRLVENDRYYFDGAMFRQKENREQFHFFMKDANRINTTLLLYEIKRRKMEMMILRFLIKYLIGLNISWL